MSGHLVLVVQNSERHEQLVQGLAVDGCCALCFHSIEEAVAYLREPGCPAYVAVFNVTLRRQSDFTALSDLQAARPELRLLLISEEAGTMPDQLSDGTLQVEILDKPLNHPESAVRIHAALVSPPSGAWSEVQEHSLVGLGSTSFTYSEDFLRRVGMADVPVLLSGETGVGKEVMALRLRNYSSRADKPFLKLNCAALPPELAESELFGCAKGAFTGAIADRQGRFETAQGGTILLDEIGDMDLRLQTKLLQVLQDGEIQPLGSNRTIKVNVRVMAATHRDLTRGIQEGTFREDLYYRLNVVKILIPPLRERQAEILPLAESLLARHLPSGQRPPVLSEKLKDFLLGYHWPGNVRELENVMRRYLVYQDATILIRELMESAGHLRPGISLAAVASFPASSNENSASSSKKTGGRLAGVDSAKGASSGGNSEAETHAGNNQPGKLAGRIVSSGEAGHASPPDRLDRLAEASRLAETEVLLDALEANRWNRRQAAASLQIEYKAFLYKLQKYGIVESKVKRREVSA